MYAICTIVGCVRHLRASLTMGRRVHKAPIVLSGNQVVGTRAKQHSITWCNWHKKENQAQAKSPDNSMAKTSVPALETKAQGKSGDMALANIRASIILAAATKALGWGQYNSMLIHSTSGTPNRRKKIL